MKKIITIECHTCGEETEIVDRYEDIDEDSINHCPYCGENENIEVLNKKKT